MRYKTLKLSILFLLGLGLIGLPAQEAIPASGGNALGNGGTVSYTVGQVVYTTNTGTNGTVAAGVQHYEISTTLSIDPNQAISLSVAAYPNPTSDFLTLSIKNYEGSTHGQAQYSDLSYQLYDISGKLLQREKIKGNQTSIPMSNYMNAIYFVKVLDKNKELKVFQIIKK